MRNGRAPAGFRPNGWPFGLQSRCRLGTFEYWTQTRTSGCNGRQKCNICIKLTRAGKTTNARLRRRRRKVAAEKVAKVLQAVRAQIQEAKAKRRAEAEERPKRTGRKRATEEARRQGHAQVLEPQQGHAVERKEYECPYCQEKIYSGVRTGNVQVAGHCGQQFRVRDGVVVRAFTHACPSCGTKVRSAKASGRLRIKHRKPNGKPCPTTVWVGK